MHTEYNQYTIDIKGALEAKFGKGKISPAVVWFLRKLLKEDLLNEFFVKGYEGVEFCTKAVEYLGVNVKVEGLENIPEKGRYTFVSNHPLGAVEALVEISLIGQRCEGDLKYLVNDFLTNIKGLAPLMVPVNKVGSSQARSLSDGVNAIFSSTDQVLVYPAGKVSRKTPSGEIMDQAWAKSFITKSVQYERDVIPMHFEGRNSWRFYAVDKLDPILRRRGINFPIAMALLPSEIKHAMGKTFTLKIGKPIPWQSFDSSKTPNEWAQDVRQKVYDL